MKKLSVIVPTKDRPRDLKKLLSCLSKGSQKFPFGDYEVIVSDDSETRSALELAIDWPWVRFVDGPKKGPAANRNAGARVARGKWLVFTDDDCQPDYLWLDAFSKHFGSHVKALEGAVIGIGETDGDLFECPVNTKGGNFWSANIAIERNMFDQLGGFDEAYPTTPTQEDIDLYFRIKRVSDVPFIRNAIVKHPVRVLSLTKALKRIPHVAASWAYHTTKNSAFYGNQSKVLIDSAEFHARVLLKSISNAHPKRAVESLVWLTVGQCLLAKNLWKQ